jgi:hypothetical protein
MSKTTVSAAGGAMPAEGHKTRLNALRASIEKTLGEMDLLLDGLAVDERDVLADAIAETLLKSPLFAGMSGEGRTNV